MKHLFLALLVFLGFQACSPGPAWSQDSGYTNLQVFDLQEIRPTAWHALVYGMMERCTGLEGSFQDVRWFIARAITVQKDSSTYLANGSYRQRRYTPDERPWVILDHSSVFNGETVSHEILHDLYSGDAPLDVAQRCMLTWHTLSVIK